MLNVYDMLSFGNTWQKSDSRRLAILLQSVVVYGPPFLLREDLHQAAKERSVQFFGRTKGSRFEDHPATGEALAASIWPAGILVPEPPAHCKFHGSRKLPVPGQFAERPFSISFTICLFGLFQIRLHMNIE